LLKLKALLKVFALQILVSISLWWAQIFITRCGTPG